MAALLADETEVLRQRGAYRAVMRTKLDRGQKFQSNAVRPFNQAVDHEHRVLLVGQPYALLQHEFADLVPPHGQARFQAELGQVICAVDRQRTAGSLFTAEADISPVAQADLLGKLRQEHHASQARRQRGNQKPVITAGDNSRHGSRRVSTQTVGNQPFACKQRFQLGHLGFAPGHFSNKFSHAGASWRQPAPFSRVTSPASTFAASRQSSTACRALWGTSTNAERPGIVQFSSIARGRIPDPP